MSIKILAGHKVSVLYDEKTIASRIRELATEINTRYADENLVIICVLKGAFMFFSDLVKHITLEPELDFVRVSSYGGGLESSKVISFTKDIEISLQDKHVLLVEDIVDTGHTIKFLVNQMQARGAKSIAIAALINKAERREIEVKVDFAGFSLSKGFIIGYGLDYAEKYREFSSIYVIDKLAE